MILCAAGLVMAVCLLLLSAPAQALAAPQSGVVSGVLVPLRQSPGCTSPRTQWLQIGQEGTVLEERGGWRKIALGETRGWVKKSDFRTAADLVRYTRDDRGQALVHQYADAGNAASIREVQRGLKYLGYYNGPQDGLFSYELQASLEDCQAVNGLPVTGRPDSNTLAYLLIYEYKMNDLVSTAYPLIGIPYTQAGASPQAGFDCSGLIHYIYKQNGYTLSRSAPGLSRAGVSVSSDDLRPGDILVFRNGGHVAMYMGDGYYIESADVGELVKLTPIRRQIDDVRRILRGR